MGKVAIIDYDCGNLYSLHNALLRLGSEPIITNSVSQIRKADRIILPGQGAADVAIKNLRSLKLIDVITHLTQPVLGICLGLQILCEYTQESSIPCLGIFNTNVTRFYSNGSPNKQRSLSSSSISTNFKVPEMGWNTLHNLCSPLFDGIEEGSYVYFIHSYYAHLCSQTIATTDYIDNFSSALAWNNFYATQFHPEKSGDIGMRILSNFLKI